jgi:hypothetical protein
MEVLVELSKTVNRWRKEASSATGCVYYFGSFASNSAAVL